MMTHYVDGFFASPIGDIALRGSQKGIASIAFVEKEPKSFTLHEYLTPYMEQLAAYFGPQKFHFHTLGLVIHGTDFQLDVWDAVMKIPYGETRTYKEIAEEVGHPKAVRAVGTAVGHNPLGLIIPCHRVVPTGGGIGEYGWGSWRKEWLLDHEKKHHS